MVSYSYCLRLINCPATHAVFICCREKNIGGTFEINVFRDGINYIFVDFIYPFQREKNIGGTFEINVFREGINYIFVDFIYPFRREEQNKKIIRHFHSLFAFKLRNPPSPEMAPKSESVEGIVLSYVNEQNRPLNSQNVADALQKFKLKKTAIQKALDTLSDSGQISFKEYGKQKIYIARQDQFNIPNSEELDQMKKANSKLQEELEAQKKSIAEVETENRALQSNLTLEEIRTKESKLKAEVSLMEEKLEKLRTGIVLVKPEDKKATEEAYREKINQWRKRKRIFKELWDTLTDNSPKDLKEFKEELGIEFDEDVGVSLQLYGELMTSKKRKRAS